MKVVILAGGLGTRLSELTKTIPKPMIKIKNKPIIFHIMKHYSKYGFTEFYIALGYKSKVIKDYFKKGYKNWKINLIYTGQNTMTGGRIKRLKKYIGKETFLATYGDGLSNVNIKKMAIGLQNIVLNTAKKLDKDVTLNVTGDDTYLPEKSISILKESFIHLLTNCVDHGIDEKGDIDVAIKETFEEIKINVRDNGKGIDESINSTLREVGQAIFFTTLILISLFICFIPTSHVGVTHFGILAVIAVITGVLFFKL